MVYIRSGLLLVLFLFIAGCTQPVTENTKISVQEEKFEGILSDGAIWRAAVPKNWNGTLLLYSRGYESKLSMPKLAPRGSEKSLLYAGYALAASQYPQAGWSVEQAIPSQVLVIEAFSKSITPPDRIIAWGSSMGGMVTAGLAQDHGELLDGAITLCASAFGAEPMMAAAFDGAFSLAQLITPEMNFSPVGRGDNFAAVGAIMAKVEQARQSATGRARVALAGVLGGIPGWTQSDLPRPHTNDYQAQEAQIAKVINMGVFLPRGDQERRAGGVFSGNSEIDYSALLDASGRKPFVEAMYQAAGASLDADLLALNNAPRTEVSENAVRYMQENFTPSGKVSAPVLSAHTIGDGMTSPALQFGYTQLVQKVSGDDMAAAVWIERAGHCSESTQERMALLSALEERINSGKWAIMPGRLNSLASNSDVTKFTDYSPYPLPRACLNNAWQCAQSVREKQ